MKTTCINLDEKLSQINELFDPQIIAECNDDKIMLVKSKGAFPWHTHEDADEFFLVLKGHIKIEFRDHAVDLKPNECAVVYKGTEHRTVALEDSACLLIELKETLNTGDITDHEYARHTQKNL